MTMDMNILFLICAAVITVRGQFFDTEYSLDSAPLPIRRRMNGDRDGILPNTGRGVEYIAEPERISNQGRRHIENNHRGNVQDGHTNRNINNFELKPFENSYQADDRNYEIIIAESQPINNGRPQVYTENYNGEIIIQNMNGNSENINQHRRNNGNNRLRTNLDNKQNSQQTEQRNQDNFPTNHNVKITENINKPNQQTDTNVHEDSRQKEQSSQTNTSNRHFDRASQSQVNQPEDASSDNIRISENPTNQQTLENSKSNVNRRADASQRAIDNNGYGNQQSIDATNNNNRNYETKPNRQNTETRNEKDNRNRESNRYTTEPARRITLEDNLVTGGTKSTEDNELVSKMPSEERSEGNDEDKWIWMSSSDTISGDGKTKKTTVEPTLPTVDDRAAFAGDKCPNGQVRYNNRCVDTE